jgi:hypothetical protein
LIALQKTDQSWKNISIDSSKAFAGKYYGAGQSLEGKSKPFSQKLVKTIT